MAKPDASAGEEAPARRRPGRKRDAAIDDRIMWAALVCYSRDGWSGFNFDAVAREAKVGKPAIYLRWNSREEMLGSAAETLSRAFIASDRGELREDLVSWARTIFEWWDSPVGWTFARLQIEMRYHAVLRHIYTDLVSRPLTGAARQIMHRAVDRGELAESANISLLLEVINGAVYTRAMAVPPSSGSNEWREGFIEALIGLVMAGTTMDLSESVDHAPATKGAR